MLIRIRALNEQLTSTGFTDQPTALVACLPRFAPLSCWGASRKRRTARTARSRSSSGGRRFSVCGRTTARKLRRTRRGSIASRCRAGQCRAPTLTSYPRSERTRGRAMGMLDWRDPRRPGSRTFTQSDRMAMRDRSHNRAFRARAGMITTGRRVRAAPRVASEPVRVIMTARAAAPAGDTRSLSHSRRASERVAMPSPSTLGTTQSRQ
jgi:hypothetical protein